MVDKGTVPKELTASGMNGAVVPRLLGLGDVSTILGLTAWGVKHLHRKAALRGVVQAGRLYWFREDVDAYLEKLRDQKD